MAESDSEISFESADEGEAETARDEVNDGTIPDETAAVASGDRDTNTAQNQEEDASSSGIEQSAKESRTKPDGKAEQKMDEPMMRDQSETKTVDSVDESRRQDEEDEVVGGDGPEKQDSMGEQEPEAANVKNEGNEKEPEGEEIVDRGEMAVPEIDAKAGGAPQHAAASSGGWGWGGWGSSLLSSAAATVTKVSDNVGKGLTSVLENVETSLGVPKPDDLREMQKQEADQAASDKSKEDSEATNLKEDDTGKTEGEPTLDEAGGEQEKEKERETDQGAGAGIGGLFSFGASAISNVMEKTVTGGLDALEMIGRKTMDILQEGDPRLEKKRALVIPRREKTSLSEILRQAKEDAEAEAVRQQEEEEHQKYNFGLLFDQFQGLAHLEALEMLSNQSETKVQSTITMVDDEALDELKTELMEVRDAFQLEDMEGMEEDTSSDQDFVNVITELLFSLSVAATPDKLQRVQKETRDWLSRRSTVTTEGSEEGDDKLEIKDVHAKAMQTLAELTARTIEQFHKVAELMLLGQEKDETSTKVPVERATALSKLASLLSAEVSSVATKFCELLSSMANKDSSSEEINTIITNIYLEASNSTSYIQDAFQLLLPIMQDIVVRRKCPED